MPKGPKGEKRHADAVQNAMLIGRIATVRHYRRTPAFGTETLCTRRLSLKFKAPRNEG
jgi:hypothetical protein